MRYDTIEPVPGTDADEVIVGGASWDENEISVKYAWPDRNGRRCRGGEFPVEAVPQMIELLVREGHVESVVLLQALINGIESKPL